jgi:hypothetical protein
VIAARRVTGAAALLLTTITLAGTVLLAWPADVLSSVNAVPAHIASAFNTPLAYQMQPDGTAYVFDRREHTVYRIDAARTKAAAIVQVGAEAGSLLRPSAFDSAEDGSFVVADTPRNKERIQVFYRDGFRVGGFELTGGMLPRITLGNLVLNGIGSLCYTGRTILISRPETGGLITEYDLYGRAQRTIGQLRATGHEADQALHLAFNAGVPLAIPAKAGSTGNAAGGGFYFVFQSGAPVFQRYDETGKLLYERRIQGRELDTLLAQQPTRWPRRTIGDTEIPLVSPTVRTARVDPEGRLWVSLAVPFTYVYDIDGDKIRTVQFRAAGIIAPTSFHFPDASRVLITPGLFEFATGSSK